MANAPASLGGGGGGGECHAVQVVAANGEMNTAAMEQFEKASGLASRSLSYAVVSIIGPQSSGKSTLLNHLFGTKFKVMDDKERSHTTMGIWIAKAVGIEPLTVVIDLEGTDGMERAEEDGTTAFEKQTGLFALAVSDVVMINMWCNSIGLEHAANRPLLKTIFEVFMRSIKPHGGHKIELLLVVRDKTKATSVESLSKSLIASVHKIWDSIYKPEAHKEAALSKFFYVAIIILPSYEYQEEPFKQQVRELRQRFIDSTFPGILAAKGDASHVIPALDFVYNARIIWDKIQQNKDLNLPAHKVLVSHFRCEESAKEKLTQFQSNEQWLEVKASVKSGPVPGFGTKLSNIVDIYLSEYDTETMYYDEGWRSAKRIQLESEILDDIVYPEFKTVAEHLYVEALSMYKNKLQILSDLRFVDSQVREYVQFSLRHFDDGLKDAVVKQAKWDATNIRNKLQQDIEAHAASFRTTKLSELKATYQKELYDELGDEVRSNLRSGNTYSWEIIRSLYTSITENVITKYSDCLSGFKLDEATSYRKAKELRDHARNIVEMRARDEAKNVLFLMKERFLSELHLKKKLLPSTGKGHQDISVIIKEASLAALGFLSVMAAIRLDGQQDNILETLKADLLGEEPLNHEGSSELPFDPFASKIMWGQVSPKNTMLTRAQCASIWKQFRAETEYAVDGLLQEARGGQSTNSTELDLALKGLNLLFLGLEVATSGISLEVNDDKYL